ncbi:hypothetical protein, variant [Aphanomyces astaci]|uniref:Alginate lyase domain-containing protein n=2 Tax=Aphanomyces astaci TaxID=112090 RepID=W4GA59_APHAT|nr:hypothetical protein, variant [Aphanomyces astaci]ETV75843.1 hypothetical protein, variant [Aphanomyces astaci]|eukprot:XP_009834484.1 hypothetical protein, variant [Aphanomyces astaci]
MFGVLSVEKPAPAAVFFARIIGNALPPRHDPARTLINLRFILENEFQDPRVHKHWVLNRILNDTVERDIMQLLDQHSASYTRLPFLLEEYADAPFSLLDQDDHSDHLHSNVELDAWNQNLLLSSIYDQKNLYAMSVNHARNAMIALGIAKGATWILPWDENCFVTKNAWQSISKDLFPPNITTDVASDDHPNYYVTWMDRLKVDNDVVLSPSYTPHAWEEPQIIFHRNAVERFDEAFRYGRRDKAALLIRLNVPGAWFDWGWSTWERQRTFDIPSQDIKSHSSHAVPSTGFVIRLFSGNPVYEDQAYGYEREMARAVAVAKQLEALDDQVMRDVLQFHPSNLVVYSEDQLLQAKDSFENRKKILFPHVHEILADADTALELLSVLLLPSDVPPSMFTDTTQWYHDVQVRFESMVYNLTALVFGSFISSDDKYTQAAVQLLHTWFVQSSRSVLPPPATLLRTEDGLVVMRTLPLFLDTLKILQESTDTSYTSGLLLHVQTWLRQYYQVLAMDKQPAKLNAPSKWFRSSTHYGVVYDSQMACLAAYLDQPAEFRFHADTVQSRLVHLASNNSVEMLRDWVIMATMAQSAGIDIWTFQGQALCGHVRCCGPTAATCNATVEDTSLRLQYGWDLVPLVLPKCPSLRAVAECTAVASAVATQRFGSLTSIRNARNWHFPPYMSLWQT